MDINRDEEAKSPDIFADEEESVDSFEIGPAGAEPLEPEDSFEIEYPPNQTVLEDDPIMTMLNESSGDFEEEGNVAKMNKDYPEEDALSKVLRSFRKSPSTDKSIDVFDEEQNRPLLPYLLPGEPLNKRIRIEDVPGTSAEIEPELELGTGPNPIEPEYWQNQKNVFVVNGKVHEIKSFVSFFGGF
ncbi:unnamed protein product [Caenorhabditis angaria]|uniref:Uncharacterized protein n=1 Tax=Caenorhabditis angaria TaxID=860376 RepID=A0A9P1IDI5_9PELO|nr:unnamed protein product [Caenorhabditis angaria]